MRWLSKPLLAAAATAAQLVVLGVVGGMPSAAAPSADVRGGVGHPSRYTNPVSAGFADTFADPSVIRGKDGWWYSYGTSDPLREGERTPHRIPMARSRDLVTWTHAGDAFSDATLPTWAAPGAGIWAPDIRYVDGQYRLYYVVTETTVTPEPNDNAIGMATAPTPTGPWTDSGAPVLGPRRGGAGDPGNFLWSFDPTVVTDTDGSQWLFYGSYYGGMFTTRLSADGRTAVGKPTMVAIDNKFEGAYAVRHAGYWYLFASTANCCAGPTTGYSVQVGRSRTIDGPYLDQQGTPLNTSRAGGTPVLTQNGNRWVGAGHNAVVTDLAGQDWIAYHAIDRADPYLDGTDGINERPMLLDRLDWVDGWPATRAGAGPSASPQQAPVTSGPSVTTAGDPTRGYRLTGRWDRATDQAAGQYLLSKGAGAAVSKAATSGDTRVEADLRSARGAAYGLALAGRGAALVTVDPARHRVVLAAGGRVATAALPAGFDAGDWHAVTLERRDGGVRAQVSHARLGDPVVDLVVTAKSRREPLRGSAFAAGAGVGVDNLSTVPAARLVTRLVRDKVPSRLDRSASDDFTGPTLRPGWQWVRQDPAATVQSGALHWPTQAADLTESKNNAAVLLRDPGHGDWTAETKVSIDLGTDTVRNFQQAGLIVYVNDDLFTRLSHVAIWNTRQTEFGKEMPYAGRLAYGGTIVGPPAETTWLRVTHHQDGPRGEHQLRAWTSRDGHSWVKGGVWTLPAAATLRVGLISHGGAGATADFDWFRLFRP